MDETWNSTLKELVEMTEESHPPRIRQAGLEAIKEISQRGDHQALDAVSARLHDKDPYIKMVSSAVLAQIAKPEQHGCFHALEQLETWLEDQNPETRKYGVQ